MTGGPETTEKKRKRKSVPGGSAKLLNVPRNWLHQALFYMDRTEFWFRICFETVWIVGLLFPVSLVLHTGISDWRVVAISIAFVHSLNWVFNANWWALALFTFPGIRNAGEKATCEFLSEMAERLRANQSIAALAVYGSPARGQWHEKSDLDLRILRNRGFRNGLAAAAITMRERAIAFLAGQPTDLFLADSARFLGKMREDERPIVLLKRGVEAEQAFQGNEEVLRDSWPARQATCAS